MLHVHDSVVFAHRSTVKRELTPSNTCRSNDKLLCKLTREKYPQRQSICQDKKKTIATDCKQTYLLDPCRSVYSQARPKLHCIRQTLQKHSHSCDDEHHHSDRHLSVPSCQHTPCFHGFSMLVSFSTCYRCWSNMCGLPRTSKWPVDYRFPRETSGVAKRGVVQGVHHK